jgi:hypothetical protein
MRLVSSNLSGEGNKQQNNSNEKERGEAERAGLIKIRANDQTRELKITGAEARDPPVRNLNETDPISAVETLQVDR